ncbi:hypothetical protein [uncultured Microbulbifer sp.]|uniref:hypothetical protein n=1 Tax=uncultured Microbulbifer sp. TaxID=348147 RepID=UPI0025F175E0|nr:hypothetical protein [uncultured Microbulbifer sp.]
MLFGNEKHPKGPSWRRLYNVDKYLSGTHVQLKTPPIRPPIPDGIDPDSVPDEFDLSDPQIYELFGGQDKNKKQDLYRALIWRNGWNFTGRPILDGETIGNLVATASVLDVRDMPVNRSLFQRSEMVELVRGIHTSSDLGQYHEGHAEDRNPFDLTSYRWPNSLSPLNTQWLERNNGCEWIYFEAQPLCNRPAEFYWLTPIGHQYCLMVHFYVNRWLRNAGNPFREQRSPIDNYRDLMEKIMETVVVELSESASLEKASIANPEGHYPFVNCTDTLVKEAKHTLYMWSGKGYTDENQPRQGGDHRAPKEDVAAFIDQRIQPHPLPGCLAIGPAYVEIEKTPNCNSEPIAIANNR